MKSIVLVLLFLPQIVLAQGRFGHEPYGPPSPLDVCVNPVTGQIVVAETEKNQVAILSSDWKPEITLGADIGIEKPVSVDTTPSGELVVLLGGEKARVVVFSYDGKKLREFACPQERTLFSNPLGVAVDDSGNIFVFDTGNHRVVVFDKNGGYQFEFGEYIWTRDFEGKREAVKDRLETPVRGDFLADGRLIVADYDGPVMNPKTGQRGGRFSVWQVNAQSREASFTQWAYPGGPYPTAKAGDVVVDRKTGEIFYNEADFPLTDHDFVRHAGKIGEDPETATNFFPYTIITHPRGVAIGSNREIIVAEADKSVAFAIPRRIFDKNFDLGWPRPQRLISSTRDSVTIQYQTLDPVQTVMKVVSADNFKYPWLPDGSVEHTGEVYTNDGNPIKDGNGVWGTGERHRITLTGLEPGKRYAYRFLVSERAYPSPLYSQTLIATTQPPVGKTQYMATRMIVLFTNLYEPAAGVPPPGPMTQEEIQGVKDRMEVGRMFYWVNSRSHLDLKYDWAIVDTESNKWPVPDWGYWPDDEHQEIDRILAEKGFKHDNTSSLFCIYGYRVWDANQKKWILAGSGGNTWGSNHDGSSATAINSGGDTAWLLIHEHGHGIGIGYQYSGQVYQFNHFHWNWFPERYGAHYDGNVAIARAFKDLEYWASVYGKLVLADDKDADGIPDNDPTCPLDEVRFGSDPAKRDTDNDGLDDREELMAYDGVGRYPGMDLNTIAPYFDPNPKNRDTDKDGILDGADKYPLYPIDPSVYKLPVMLDGKVGLGEYSKGFNRPLADPDMKGSVRMAYTDDYLVFSLVQKVQDYKKPAAIRIELDANNDGMTVGADNQEIEVHPKDDGSCDVSTYYNDTIIRMKPIWINKDYPMPQDCFARWSKVGDEYQLEFAIPKTFEAGIRLDKWKQMGVLIYLTPDTKSQRRLFQLQQLVEMTLK